MMLLAVKRRKLKNTQWMHVQVHSLKVHTKRNSLSLFKIPICSVLTMMMFIFKELEIANLRIESTPISYLSSACAVKVQEEKTTHHVLR